MLVLLIHRPGHKDLVAKLPPGNFLVGAGEDCQLRLTDANLGYHHAELIAAADGSLTLVDMGDPAGVAVNGRKMAANASVIIGSEDIVSVGTLTFNLAPAAAPVAPVTPVATAPAASPVAQVSVPDSPLPAKAPAVPATPEFEPTDTGLDEYGKEKIPVLKISGISDSARPVIQEIKKLAHAELLKRMNLKKMAVSGASSQDLADKATGLIREILSELTIPLPENVDLQIVEKELLQEAIGLGPLEYLLGLEDITEIMVNGPDHVYVERGGVLYRTDTAFADNNQVLSAIERIVSPLGRRIDESSPMVDARLSDGSRVNAVIPPLSLVGPAITIRKFAKKPYQAADLIKFGTLSEPLVKFLDLCIKVRKNIVISGGTGSGKTTLLNVLSTFLPNRERIVTIEDAAELQLHQEHLVRMEARPPNVEGRGEITIRDLVRNALRMRPDRIVVGECRGGEALDMLQAMNTGHDGSLTTVHANSPRDALARLETLVMMAGFDLPLRAIREQIASAVHIIVQVSRERDGSRKVTNISEITKMEGEVITMQDLFVYEQTGWTADGKMLGRHVPTGSVPTFLDEIKRAKLPVDMAMFDPKQYQ